MTNELKLGYILQSIGQNAKYHIYATDSLESLEGKSIIGIADSYSEACKIIRDYLNSHNITTDRYWRYILAEEATFIDYGSWSKFLAIVPPVDTKDIFGESAT